MIKNKLAVTINEKDLQGREQIRINAKNTKIHIVLYEGCQKITIFKNKDIYKNKFKIKTYNY